MEGFKMNLCCICLLFFLTMLADSSSSTLDSIVKRRGPPMQFIGLRDVKGFRRQMCGEGEEYSGTRIQPINPLSKVKVLPFNRYSWLTTHKSLDRIPWGDRLPNTTSITSQLYNGVRGLMLEMYDFKDDIWLCHSFGGNCYNYTCFIPATYVLKEVRNFLESNPTEIVTIFIEDHVTSPNGLKNIFRISRLKKFWFPVSQMPKTGVDWPTVDDMIKQNQRLVVFTSKASKESSEGIAYKRRYVVEYQCGMAHRAESPAMNITSRSLVLMNYFPDKPDISTACKHESGPLASMETCSQAAGGRWPNFIAVHAVHFYKTSEAHKILHTSDGGGAHEAVDMAFFKFISYLKGFCSILGLLCLSFFFQCYNTLNRDREEEVAAMEERREFFWEEEERREFLLASYGEFG